MHNGDERLDQTEDRARGHLLHPKPAIEDAAAAANKQGLVRTHVSFVVIWRLGVMILLERFDDNQH